MKNRLNSIYTKIEDIEYFIKKCDGKIMTMLEDRVYMPATRMHLISIAEQFSKLEGKEYDKQGDFINEGYSFDETTCKVSLDFKKVFARFRG